MQHKRGRPVSEGAVKKGYKNPHKKKKTGIKNNTD